MQTINPLISKPYSGQFRQQWVNPEHKYYIAQKTYLTGDKMSLMITKNKGFMTVSIYWLPSYLSKKQYLVYLIFLVTILLLWYLISLKILTLKDVDLKRWPDEYDLYHMIKIHIWENNNSALLTIIIFHFSFNRFTTVYI